MDLVILAVFWLIWCSLHSGLISLKFLDYAEKKTGKSFRFYRFFYNVLSLVTIVLVLIYERSLEYPVLFRFEGIWYALQLFFLLFSLLLFFAGSKSYNMQELFGVNQIRSGNTNTVLTGSGKLSRSGMLKVMRHPWYFAAIIFVWSVNREWNSAILLTKIFLSVYVIIGTLLEEKKLTSEFGEEYSKYKKEVSMLFPWKWVKSKIIKRSSNVRNKNYS
ncbi:methyltransferase family protein [candidate division KSB1 bacterium]